MGIVAVIGAVGIALAVGLSIAGVITKALGAMVGGGILVAVIVIMFIKNALDK